MILLYYWYHRDDHPDLNLLNIFIKKQGKGIGSKALQMMLLNFTVWPDTKVISEY